MNIKGLTLSELLLAAAILSFVLVGLLALFINCIFLNENNRNFTLAYSAIQSKIEEIKNTDFNSLYASCPSPRPAGCFCHGDTFDLEGFSAGRGKARITIEYEGASSNLKRVKIAACFMSRNRLIGDDINNCQSSPVELVTLIAK